MKRFQQDMAELGQAAALTGALALGAVFVLGVVWLCLGAPGLEAMG